MRFRPLTKLALLAALLPALAAGCGDGGATATVSGTVSYAGAPVEEGSIQFTPKSGKGAVAGGTVAGGKFSVANVGVGPMVVYVSTNAPSGAGSGGGPVSTGDLAKAAQDRQAAKAKDAPAAAAAVPPDATGNNATFDVKAGANTLQLDLTPPKGAAK